MSTLTNFLSALVIVVITFAINLYSETFVLSIVGVAVPSAALIAMAIVGLKSCEINKDHERLSHQAEEVYIFGYVFTLVAILGVALRIGLEVNGLVQAASIKIVTAIIGLICLIALKRVAFTWGREVVSAQELYEVEVNQRVRDFESTIQNLKDTAYKINTALDLELLESFARLTMESKGQIESLHESSKHIRDSYSSDFASYLDQLKLATAESRKSIEEEIKVRKELGLLNANLTKSSEAVESFTETVTTGDSEMQRFIQVECELRESARSLEGKTTGIAKDAGKIQNELNRLSERYQELGMSVDNLSNEFGQLQDLQEVLAGLKKVFSEILVSIQSINQPEVVRSLESIEKQMAEVANSANSISANAKSFDTELVEATGKTKKLEESTEMICEICKSIASNLKTTSENLTYSVEMQEECASAPSDEVEKVTDGIPTVDPQMSINSKPPGWFSRFRGFKRS